jgi:tetratricopeptide (TPR) repeat protein
MRSFVLALLLLSSPALAAQKPPAAAIQKPPVTPQQRLNDLFGQLAQVEQPEDAKPIEDEINAIFAQSGSPSVDVLMGRAQVALTANKLDVARKLVDAITRIAPNFAEGWHRLAVLQAQVKDDRGAMISLQKAVTLNPRNFTAYAELAGFLEDYGDKPGALKLLRKALTLNPKMENVEKEVKGLTRDVEGQGI